MLKKIALVTGGFDPLHSGHIQYFKSAKLEGEILLVGINSDDWLSRKKGRFLLGYQERLSVIESLYMVDKIVKYDDSDDTSIKAIHESKKLFPQCQIIFCNGGDRGELNTPEYDEFLEDDLVIFKFNIGGTKVNSSSEILKRWEKIKK